MDAAADVIAGLEGAEGSLLFASGMSAIVTTLFTFLRAGDHAVSRLSLYTVATSLSVFVCPTQVICRPCYGGVNAFVEEYLCQLGVEVTWVPVSSVKAYKDAVQENTKVSFT